MIKRISIVSTAICVLAAALGGCKPDVDSDPSSFKARVQTVFDPAVGMVPLPNDILIVEGKVEIPTTVNPCGKGDVGLFPPAMEEFTREYLNLLDGFLPEQALTFAFWSPDPENLLVDPMKMKEGDVRVFEVSDLKRLLGEETNNGLKDAELMEAVKDRLSAAGQLDEVTGMQFSSEFTEVDYSELLADCFSKPLRTQFFQMSATPPSNWEPGETYAAFVLTSISDTGDDQAPIVSPITFNFLKSIEPLIEPSKDPDTNDAPLSLIPATDEEALMLEEIRLELKPILDWFEGYAPVEQQIDRARMALAWTFTVSTAGSIVFDPSTGAVPAPTDLILDQLKDPVTATSLIPEDPAGELDLCDPGYFFDLDESVQVQAAFFCWLKSLDGFSANSAPAAAFTRPLDADTVSAETARFLDITGAHPEEVTGAALAYNAAKRQVGFTPSSTLDPGHRYLVVLLDGLDGKETTGEGENEVVETYDIVPSPAMAMLKLTKPLVSNGVTQVPGLVSDADAPAFEAVRLQYEPILAVLDDMDIPREDIVGFFTFTVSSSNEALFDPNVGVIPFPNEVLLDQDLANQGINKVKMPISDSDPAALQALLGGLNTLDGFSTMGSLTTSFSKPLDDGSIVLALDAEFEDATDCVKNLPTLLSDASIGIADITDAMDPNDPTQLDPTRLGELKVIGPDVFDVTFKQDQLIVTPAPGRPLPPNRRYMVVLFDRLETHGDDNPIIVSPTFFLARSPFPLAGQVDCAPEELADDPDKVCWTSFLPQLLSNDDAAQLEGLRSAYGAIFDNFTLFGIEREQVLLFFTFNTATTYAELASIIETGLDTPNKPLLWGGELQSPLSQDVKDLFGDSPMDGLAHVCVDCAVQADILLSDPDESDPDNPVMGHFQVDEEGLPEFSMGRKLPFIFTLPAGAGPFEVVLFQHGLDGSREDVVDIASDLALAGFATVSIDAPLHGDHPVRTEGTASGTDFFTADVMAVRDNIREAVLDQYQITRFIREGRLTGFVRDELGLDEGDDPLVTEHVHYLGVSLGGITGAVSAGMIDGFDKVALVTAGGHLMSIFMDTPNTDFKQPLVDALASLGIEDGTPEFLQFVDFAQWALDRADPVNFGWVADAGTGIAVEDRFLVIEAVGDDFIPNSTTEELHAAMSLADGTSPPLLKYTGDSGGDLCHGFFMEDCGPEAVRQEARAEVVKFFNGETPGE